MTGENKHFKGKIYLRISSITTLSDKKNKNYYVYFINKKTPYTLVTIISKN